MARTIALTCDQRCNLRSAIAHYPREQRALLRVLRRHGQLNERDFDRIFYRRRPWLTRRFRMTDNAPMLGDGATEWSKWLDLTQMMMALGIVDAREEGGIVVYRIADTEAK